MKLFYGRAQSKNVDHHGWLTTKNFKITLVNIPLNSSKKSKIWTKNKWLRILTRKKHRQIKLQRLEKVWIWAVGTLNQLFIRAITETKLSKNKVVTSKTPFSVISPFCNYHSICLDIGFWCGSFVWKWYLFNISAIN